jgi:hypothetical protein
MHDFTPLFQVGDDRHRIYLLKAVKSIPRIDNYFLSSSPLIIGITQEQKKASQGAFPG